MICDACRMIMARSGTVMSFRQRNAFFIIHLIENYARQTVLWSGSKCPTGLCLRPFIGVLEPEYDVRFQAVV